MATIIKGKNARKPYTVRYYYEGKQREKSFATSREARDFKIKFEHDAREQIFVDPREANAKFADVAAGWLSRHPGAPKTKNIYEQALRLHVNPAFGGKPLAAVARDREGVEAFLRETLPAKGLGASMARTCYMVLNAVVNDAIKSGRLNQTRLRGIRLPAAPVKAEIPFATQRDIRNLASYMPEPYGFTVYLMRGCGLRLGESLGVQAADFADGTLRLGRQLAPAGREHIPLKHRGEGDYRDIPLPDYVANAMPLPWTSFPGVNHRQYRGWFTTAREKAGLPSTFTPHTLRHIFASVCLAGGVPITDVSKWLGHRSIQVTFGIYGHLVPASWDRARGVLDEEWKS